MELLPWGNGSGSAPQRKKERKATYQEIFRLRLFWMIGISYLFISASFYAIFTFIVMYGVMEIGVSHATASGLVTQMSLSGLLGAPVMLFVSDSIGRKKTILLCQLFIFLSGFGLIGYVKDVPNDIAHNLRIDVSNVYKGMTITELKDEIDKIGDLVYQGLVDKIGKENVVIERKEIHHRVIFF